MSHLFAGSLRHGAMILFVIALLVFATSLLSYLTGFPGSGPLDNSGQEKPQPLANVWMILMGTANALHSAALLFFGALVIDRFDGWREARA